ncbi:MAG: N-acetylmuramoyl-L-alanine amidase [Patescibacteria group bacterium]|nr:N-acetylmuramoyl-L-alanine amidase [Patescibacteria group bacterium]
MRHLTVALLLSILILVPWLAFNYPNEIRVATNTLASALADAVDQLAAVIMHNPRTIAGIQSKYDIAAKQGAAKVRILVVPGHEPGYGGAEFGSLKERDMTVELAGYLDQFLRQNGRYEVFTTRDANSWLPPFADYFKEHWNDIVDWEKSYHTEQSRLISVGAIPKPKVMVYHNTAPADVATRLYGITKWANENNIDITIHIHFNDYPGHANGVAGEYSGFAIYVPSAMYLNSTTTKAVADAVFNRLKKYNPVSNMPDEKAGVIDDPELIAVGANNTADSASMLIEYGYIYEPQFVDPDTRSLALKDLAFQTYLGLQDFFGAGNNYSLAYDTLVLPYRWQREMSVKSAPGDDIYALQSALTFGGLYPPNDKSKNDCPRTGTFGACTMAALADFQKENGITGENGVTGPKTLQALNKQFGSAVGI